MQGKLHDLGVQAALFFLAVLIALPQAVLAAPTSVHPLGVMTGPSISAMILNLNQYPGGEIPAYKKLEITFEVDTDASNLQMPYDPAPPAGVQPGVGITVNALFTPDNWATVYTQPAFYYQQFEEEIRNKAEWLYPTDDYVWMVRFSPPRPGEWQFKLTAQDASGFSQTAPQTFRVVPSDGQGFVRVSPQDSRYFEFENGDYFPALGYNMNFDHVQWTNPVLDNQANFEKMSENGIQLVRLWLSQWGIYGPSWNPWNSTLPEQYTAYIPGSATNNQVYYPGSDVSMRVDAQYNPCMYLGFMKPRLAVKPYTTYRLRVRYKTMELAGPRIAGKPWGFVAKTGGWMDGSQCQDPGNGTIVSAYQNQNTSDWQTLEGSIRTSDKYFLGNFFLTVENVTAGSAFIDYVWIEEDLGNGQFGPNIVPKPWMAHHLYMEQRNSRAFDKVVELAEQNGVYLRPVILEKNDWIFNRIDDQGRNIANDPACKDKDPSNDPAACPGNGWFYGKGREVTKVRWLQQAWWRYLQARWGYSTAIQSWELLNEGDPASAAHFKLADEFGKYMRQFAPNHHLISTSFWHSFPNQEFWSNSGYPNVDFADVHLYIPDDDAVYADPAASTYNLSMKVGAKMPGGAGKPVIRGETGLVVGDGGSKEVEQDLQGVWLHNYLWAQINSGGLIESYWYENQHIYKKNSDGTYRYDHRPQYRAFYNFVRTLPLNNGRYEDAAATSSSSRLRAWGQKDLVGGQAHLWLQNQDHTWQGAIAGTAVAPIQASVTLPGFINGKSYRVEWWDPYQPDPTRQILRTETVTVRDGKLTLQVTNLTTDVAVKIFLPQSPTPTPETVTATPVSPTPTTCPPTATPTQPTATLLPPQPTVTATPTLPVQETALPESPTPTCTVEPTATLPGPATKTPLPPPPPNDEPSQPTATPIPIPIGGYSFQVFLPFTCTEGGTR